MATKNSWRSFIRRQRLHYFLQIYYRRNLPYYVSIFLIFYFCLMWNHQVDYYFYYRNPSTLPKISFMAPYLTFIHMLGQPHILRFQFLLRFPYFAEYVKCFIFDIRFSVSLIHKNQRSLTLQLRNLGHFFL